ncbi:MAG: hypothetical protein J3Q66DRAFT_371398 [Benniella sp.]|nr:MAG: hypothetical protein J3Q66DRAFT_371398 [Benniella sp.]
MNNSKHGLPWTRNEELELLNHLQERVNNGSVGHVLGFKRVPWTHLSQMMPTRSVDDIKSHYPRIKRLVRNEEAMLRWCWSDNMEVEFTPAVGLDQECARRAIEASNSERVAVLEALKRARDSLSRFQCPQDVLGTAEGVLSNVITKMVQQEPTTALSGWARELRKIPDPESWLAARDKCKLLVLQEMQREMLHAIQNEWRPLLSAGSYNMMLGIIDRALRLADLYPL